MKKLLIICSAVLFSISVKAQLMELKDNGKKGTLLAASAKATTILVLKPEPIGKNCDGRKGKKYCNSAEEKFDKNYAKHLANFTKIMSEINLPYEIISKEELETTYSDKTIYPLYLDYSCDSETTVNGYSGTSSTKHSFFVHAIDRNTSTNLKFKATAGYGSKMMYAYKKTFEALKKGKDLKGKVIVL